MPLEALAFVAMHQFRVSALGCYLLVLNYQTISDHLAGCCWVVESDEGVGNFLEGFSTGGFSHPHDLAYQVGREV